MPGCRPRGRDSTCAPKAESSETRNSDIYDSARFSYLPKEKDVRTAADFDDIWAALFIRRDGWYGYCFAET